jgi:hypothetical protein
LLEILKKLLPQGFKLPGKKLNIKNKIKSWQLIAAVVSSVAVIGGGVGVFAYQSYTQSQQSAGEIAQSALEVGQERVDALTDEIADLEVAIKNALEIEALSKDKTLDEKARKELAAEIEKAKNLWVEYKTNLIEIEQALGKLRSKQIEGVWAEDTAVLARAIIDESKGGSGDIVAQVSNLGKSIGLVQTAQDAWQKEQDRIIAAEAAARMAKAKAVPAVSTITDDGGASAVTAPVAPPVNAPPKQGPTTAVFLASVAQAKIDGVSPRSFIESYIRALAPNVIFDWTNARLCDGYYVCGRAMVGISQAYLDKKYGDLGMAVPTLPAGFPVSQVVEIQLDPRLEEVYLNENGIGRFVLVHESAHARQWLKYGSNIVAANESYTGPTGVKGTAAVEYMADCMSISYLGYFVEGSYTTSCTPEQLVAANSTW